MEEKKFAVGDIVRLSDGTVGEITSIKFSRQYRKSGYGSSKENKSA